jgi:hypothetical protein
MREVFPCWICFFKTRKHGDIFSSIVGKSPAYYDPFFFAGACYFLLISIIGVLHRYWAGSLGLSFRGLIFRDSYILGICVLYYFWIQGSSETGSTVYTIAGHIHPFLNTELGVALVTLAYAVVMLLSILLAVFLGFIGMIPRKSAAAQ